MTTIDLPDRAPDTAGERARRAMIDSQLRPSGVNAVTVLRRMGQVPREDFVPPQARALAYMDRALHLPGGGWLPAPLVQGLTLQEAAITGSERAIVVDAGSGYLAELVRPLVASLDVLTPAAALLPGAGGPEADLLLVDGAAEQLPEPLIERLAEGARIVTGILENGVTRLAAGRKAGGRAALIPLYDLGIPVIAAFERPRRWSF